MYARFSFEHSPRNLHSSHYRQHTPPFVFNSFRTLPFLGYHPTLSSSVACALLAKNTGGTPLGSAFPKLKRVVRVEPFLIANLELITVIGNPPFPLTPAFPPLTQCPSVSPLHATLTKRRGRVRYILLTARPSRGVVAPRVRTHGSRATHHQLAVLLDSYLSISSGEHTTCGSC